MFARDDVIAPTPGDLVAEGWIIDLGRRSVFPCRIVIAGGHVPMIPHSTEKDLSTRVETACVGPRAVVPFTCAEGCVPRLPQRFAQHGVFLGDPLSLAFDVVEGAACMKHRTAGHAHRTARSSHDVAVDEARPSRHELIQVGRRDFRMIQRMNRVETLIIGEEEDDVGSAHYLPFPEIPFQGEAS